MGTQWLLIISYSVLLHFFKDTHYWLCTIPFGIIFAYVAIQNIYINHDVMHGATFPPYWWQKYLTHPFADFFSLPWEEFILEHNRHHASTVDLLIQGEFGWDPEEYHYYMQQWSDKWYCLMLTVPFIPVLHSSVLTIREVSSRSSGTCTFQTRALVASATRNSGTNGCRDALSTAPSSCVCG